MKLKLNLYQVDAFTDRIFGGNPACVIPLDSWLPDDTLLKIAKENAVAETAFFLDLGDKIHLSWFTPEIEIDLCGHATLATAHCLKTILNHNGDEINGLPIKNANRRLFTGNHLEIFKY